MRTFLGDNDMMAYLAMMATRLIELHRVLKPTGSLYLHCDPTASHYLKLLLDGVFGASNYRNEITWKRTTTHSDSKTWSKVSDTLLFYTKGSEFTWHTPRETHSEDYLASKYRHDDGDGRGRYMLDNMTSPNPRPNMTYEWLGFLPPAMGWRFQRSTMQKLHDEERIYYPSHADGTLDTTRRPRIKKFLSEMPGGVMGAVWTDISPINSQAQERLGYPTQKPLVLLERIIAASSNEGDIVLDPFCGCGTAVHAAQKLGRQWIGIDVTHLAIHLIEKRLKDAFPGLQYEVHGTPRDLASAQDLARRDKHQFELWALAQVDAQPWRGGRKGADGGIDGIIYFKPDGKRTERAIVEVKGGGTGVKDIGRLAQVMEREKAPLGVFITAEHPNSCDGKGRRRRRPLRGRMGPDLSPAPDHHSGRAVPGQKAGDPVRRPIEPQAGEARRHKPAGQADLMAVKQHYEIEGRRWLSIARAAKLLGTNAQGVRKLMGSGALDWCQSRANSTRLVVDEAGVMQLRVERPPTRNS